MEGELLRQWEKGNRKEWEWEWEWKWEWEWGGIEEKKRKPQKAYTQ